MRVIGGTYRGLKLDAPSSDKIRPTTDRMRETLFNMLEHGTGPGVRNARVLDLFSGTGALGIEAMSRHAQHVTFVDRDLKPTRQNYTKLKNPAPATFLQQDATSIKPGHDKFDIVFMDPPYHKDLITPALTNLNTLGMIDDQGIVVIEYAADEKYELPADFQEIKRKKIGDAVFSILEKSS